MLYHDFLTNASRLIHKCPHYIPIYERHFSKFKNQSIIFWEIGIGRGGSLQMWKRYLGPFATIVGIDINPFCKEFEEDQIHVRIGDQSDTFFLQKILDEFGPPDIVLDDGSHMMRHICATFDFLYNKVSKNGVYLVEDLCTAYDDTYGGGLKRTESFIEHCKDLIDSLNARHCNLPQAFGDSTYSMAFYDSVVVFEKIVWMKDSYRSIITPKGSWWGGGAQVDTKSRHVVAQLFWDINGYNEIDSLVNYCIINDQQFSVAFNMLDCKDKDKIKRIRFDPATEPIGIKLIEASAIYDNAERCSLQICCNNSAYKIDDVLYFDNNDPIIEFNTEDIQFKRIVSVEFQCGVYLI